MKIVLPLAIFLSLLSGVSLADTKDDIAAAEKAVATLKSQVAPLASSYLVKDVDIKADISLDPIIELIQQVATQSVEARTFSYQSTARTGHLWWDGADWCGSYAQLKNDDSFSATGVIDTISAQIADDGGILINADLTISVKALLDFHFYGPRSKEGVGPISTNACSMKDAHLDFGWTQGVKLPNDHEHLVVRIALKMGTGANVDYQVQIIDPAAFDVRLQLGFKNIGSVPIPQRIPLPDGPIASGSFPLLFQKSGVLAIPSLAKERPYTLLLVPNTLQTSKAGITESWMAFARFKGWSSPPPPK